MAYYRTGTLSVTNGSTAVVGTGTDFINGAAIGECIQAPDSKLYEIASIASATALTLGQAYLGATVSGQSYSIVPTQSYIRDLASQAATLINGYAATQTGVGAGKFGDGTVTVPGIRFTSDDNTGLRRTGADAVALVTGGVDRITVSAAGAVAMPGTLAVTGVITGPTAVAATNTTQLATTAHVFAERTNAATLTNKTLNSPVLVTPALGTPASGVLTNATGLPVATGIAGLGTGVATFLATPTSANLAAALTNETGTGTVVLSDSAALTGNPTAPTPAFGDSDASIATTAFVQREKEYLPVLSQSLHVGSIVKAIVYDTSKDSDGGAWRQRCQDKSWYTETLGGSRWIGQEATIAQAWADAGSTTGAVFQASATAGPLTVGKFYTAISATTATEVFRGVTRDFPAVAGIVAESARAVIYDLSTGAMWMVFVVGASNHVIGSLASLGSLQGLLLVGQVGSGLTVANFAKDLCSFTNTGAPNRRAVGGIVARNGGLGLATSGGDYGSIISTTINDVAITVLDNAPIDPATGLPVPTIAVATAGGISVIRDNGTVVNSAIADAFGSVSFTPEKRLTAMRSASGALRILYVYPLSLAAAFTHTENYASQTSGTTIPALLGSSLQVTATKDTSVGSSVLGVTMVKRNPSLSTVGMVSYITSAYNTGWQVGDSRGAYLADTVAETITASGELVTNGTFTADTSGWTAQSTAVLAVVSGELEVTASGAAQGASQTFTVIAGKTYTLGVTARRGTATSLGFWIYQGAFGAGTPAMVDSTSTTNVALQNTVTATSTQLTVYIRAASAGTVYADNISVKLAEPDRSVKNTGLVINGTLTKTAVASGAGLVAYSGFSAANYLEQPYSNQLDFGTGDFCVMGWATNNSGTDTSYLYRRPVINNSTGLHFWSYGNAFKVSVGAGATIETSAGVFASNAYNFITVCRVSGLVSIYINGVFQVSATRTDNITDATAVLRLGTGMFPAAGIISMALWRISATAPSADQIAHIYRTELPLFQANAQCTIAGTSTGVTALAYDDSTDLLHVGTSWGRSGFKDLLRVDSEATTTGALTSLSAQGGTVITGGTSAKVYVPAKYLRDELQRQAEARQALGRIPVFFDFDAVTSQVAFVLPKGYTTKAVYSAGLLKRMGSTKDYLTSTDGFAETVTFAVAPGNTVQVSIMAVRA